MLAWSRLLALVNGALVLLTEVFTYTPGPALHGQARRQWGRLARAAVGGPSLAAKCTQAGNLPLALNLKLAGLVLASDGAMCSAQ